MNISFLRFIIIWYRNVSIAKKLYFTVGIMTMLIVVELFILLFAINTLSAVRAYVGLEGLWSKAQKNAIFRLEKYSKDHDIADYQIFRKQLQITLGDKKARLELEKKKPDLEVARQSFLEGMNHPDDIEGMIEVFRRFHFISYINRVLAIWEEADHVISQIIPIGEKLHTEINSGAPSQQKIDELMEELAPMNVRLTKLENDFSYTLGVGSRWLENIISNLVLIMAFTIVISGLLLTVSVYKSLSRGLSEISRSSKAIARGDFSTRATIYSKDEIGVLANSFNNMAGKLEQNIKERKIAGEKIKQSRASLAQAQQIAHLGSWEWDIATNSITWSDELYSIYGLKPQEFEVTYEAFLERVHPDDRERVNKLISDSRDHKEDLDYYHRIIRKNDGAKRILKCTGNISQDENGSLIQMAGTAQDVTEAKQAEHTLARENAYIKLLQKVAVAANEENSIEGVAQLCLNEICKLTNSQLGHLYLVSETEPDKLLSTKIWLCESESSQFEGFKSITEEMNFESGIGLPGRIFKNKAPVWISDIIKDSNFLRKEPGKVLGVKTGFGFPIMSGNKVFGVLEFFSTEVLEEDKRLLEMTNLVGTQIGRVIERKQTEDLLQASEKQIRAVVQTAYDAFILIDEKGAIADWNPQAETTFGWKREEVLGRKLSETIIPVRYREAHEKGLKHFKNTGEGPVIGKRMELSGLHRDGREFPLEFTISHIRINETNMFSAFLHDISERKKAEEQQKQITEELNQFAYVVSHDLKAPLRSIGSLSGWLVEDYADKIDENGKEQFRMLQKSVKRMHQLIEGILEYSRIGRIEGAKEDVNLNKVVAEVIEILAPPSNFSVKIEKELPVIKAERTRMLQLFQNLISNAVKYMDKPEGIINIGVKENALEYEFKVEDNGPGINKKDHERIFQIFQTGSGEQTDESHGIGLTIVKRIVKLYKGKIWVESEPGKGAKFYFTIAKG